MILEIVCLGPVDLGQVGISPVLTMRDVTERKSLDDKLRRQALHDALTDLPNKLMFHDSVEGALDRAKRLGGEVAGIAVLIELPELGGRKRLAGYAVSSLLQY